MSEMTAKSGRSKLSVIAVMICMLVIINCVLARMQDDISMYLGGGTVDESTLEYDSAACFEEGTGIFHGAGSPRRRQQQRIRRMQRRRAVRMPVQRAAQTDTTELPGLTAVQERIHQQKIRITSFLTARRETSALPVMNLQSIIRCGSTLWTRKEISPTAMWRLPRDLPGRARSPEMWT